MELTAQFKFEKETKNMVRFKEIVKGPTEPPIIGTLYVSKLALQEDFLKYAEYPDLQLLIRAM